LKRSYHDPWLAHYLHGSSKEMYTEYLSPTFTGKTFTQTAIICYTKLKLLLLAVELSNENGIGSHLTINPGSAVKIESGTRGFFIAGSSDETKKAYYYCELCHKDVTDLKLIKKCKCHRGKKRSALCLILLILFLEFC
jgi:potassium large conductance calcium-activated channel subfamily M alpha protein 1